MFVLELGANICVKSIIGAIFCVVASIQHIFQEEDVITGGNQKWHGAIPNFINIAKIIK